MRSGSASQNTPLSITGAGRVGIGTTSPSSKLVIEDSSAFKIAVLRTATAVVGMGVESGPYVYSDGALQFRVGATAGGSADERARIDTSGRLLVGTSTARTTTSFAAGGAQLQVEGITYQSSSLSLINNQASTDSSYLIFGKSRGTSTGSATVVNSNDLLGALWFAGADGTSLVRGAMIEAFVDATPGTGDMPGRLVFSTTADGTASPTERMRITAAGALSYSPCSGADVVGTEACGFIGDGIYAPVYKVKSALTTTKNCAIFVNGNGQVGSIQMSASATSYNTSSDYRLKENVLPITSAANRVQQLKPRRFNFIADPEHTVDGFIAHEAQAIVPECVTGDKDAVDADGNPIYQGIDQSKLVPLLTAALQEAITEIASLKDRVAALEAS